MKIDRSQREISPGTPCRSSAWSGWCWPGPGAPRRTASGGTPRRPRRRSWPPPPRWGGGWGRSPPGRTPPGRHNPGQPSRRVWPSLPPAAGLCASLSWTARSRWGDTSTPRASASSRRPRRENMFALLRTTEGDSNDRVDRPPAFYSYQVVMIITRTLYTERWLPSLSSSGGREDEEARLQTPLTSSSCMAHCFSFLESGSMKMTSTWLDREIDEIIWREDL